MRITAYLFDLDGVLTPTALVHQAAWTETFDRFLDEAGSSIPFTEEDYLAFVDGKPRYDGVRSFLRSRGVNLAEGTPADPPGLDTVQALGNLKNEAFRAVLNRDGIAPYPDALALVDELDDRQVPWVVVSSSANAIDVLTAAGLARRAAFVVDAGVATKERLAGKPSPDTFLYAAHSLGHSVDRCAVVEDAVAGVMAGRAGGFGLVVGVARHGGGVALSDAGADLVVTDLTPLIANPGL
jgi:HAD superfamily hydrolase (TIGR01509 family)